MRSGGFPAESSVVRDSGTAPSGLPSLLSLLMSHLALLGAFALAGGILSYAALLLRSPSYRAVTTLMVLEPRMGNGAVDFYLTPIRSYIALLSSPSVCDSCASNSSRRPAMRPKVRMPENTRLLEVSFDGRDPAEAARFVNCVAARALEENRRLNAEIQSRMSAMVSEALDPATVRLEKLEREMTVLRSRAGVELKHKELRQALADLETSREERLKAQLRLAEAQSRSKSFRALLDPHAASSETVRQLAEKGAAEAVTEESSARAISAESERLAAIATGRAATLEKELSRTEDELERLRRKLEGVAAIEGELLRRSRYSALEAASKAFDLVVMAPATPPDVPSTPPAWLVMSAGAFAGFVLAALFVLSRP